MDLNFKLYTRGFLFTDFKTDKVPSYYTEQVILNSYYYYKSNDVDSAYVEDDCQFIIIHGHFTYVEPGNEINNDDLPIYLLKLYKNNYSAYLNALDFLAGRYVIIIGDSETIRFYPDASNTRSVYYSLKYNIVSSHAHFINDIIKHDIDEVSKNIRAYKINWNHSPYKEIKSLSPNLYLNFLNKNTKRFFPRFNNKYTQVDEEEKLSLIEKMWKSQYKYYFTKFDKFAFSITGGWDSRISLSLFKEKMDEIEFFTYTTHQENKEQDQNKNLLLSDGNKVRELLRDIPLNHRFIVTEEVPKKLSEKDREVVKKNIVSKHNVGFLRIYKTLFPNENTLHIRSNLHEIGRAYILPPKNTPSTVKRLKSYYINTFNRLNKKDLENYDFNVEEFTEQGIKDFHLDDETYDYHKMDLFYWQNRMGRWHSEIMNETDVCFETFSPFNVRAIIDITLSFEFQKRKNNYVFSELINRNYPVLNFYGKNKLSNLYEDNKILLNQIENQADSYQNLIKQSRRSSERMYEKISEVKKLDVNRNQRIENSLEKIISLNLDNIEKMQRKINEKEERIINYFSEFTSGDETNQYTVKMINNNTLYIDSNISNSIYYAEVYHEFKSDFGALNLVLSGEDDYKFKAEYEVLLNEELLLTQCLEEWDLENSISIFNLNLNDKITIRLKHEKQMPVSYYNSPKVTIKKLDEIKLEKTQALKIVATSPSSNIIK